jgi:hypothetical protein
MQRKISTVKPWASRIASVHPSGEPASSLGARLCSAPRPLFLGLTAAIAHRPGSHAPAAPASSAARRPPAIPHLVHTVRGPNDGTGDHGSALRIVLWWHTQQHTSSDRTPFARMLPSVIG